MTIMICKSEYPNCYSISFNMKNNINSKQNKTKEMRLLQVRHNPLVDGSEWLPAVEQRFQAD